MNIICPDNFYEIACILFNQNLIKINQNNIPKNINTLIIFEKKIDLKLLNNLQKLKCNIYGINIYLDDNILFENNKIVKIFNKLYFKFHDDYLNALNFFENDFIFYNNVINIYSNLIKTNEFKKKNEKRIGFCISNNENNLTLDILTKLRITSKIPIKNLIVFHTEQKNYENLKKIVTETNFNKKYILEDKINLSLLKQFDLIITSHYQIFIFCLIQNIPVIPFGNNIKLLNSIKDLKYPYTCKSVDDFGNIFDNILNKINKQQNIPFEIKNTINDNIVMNNGKLKLKINKLVDEIYDKIENDVQNEHHDKNKIINFHIYNDIFSLEEDYSNFDKNVCQSLIYKKKLNSNNPKFKLKNFNFNNEVHRAGWKFVCDELINYHSNDDNLILLDTYVDKTFHWDYITNKYLNQVPYTKPWIGIIHHPYNDTTPYNSVDLFKNDDFIKSLKYCRGLICLSNDLKNKIKNKLCCLNIPVYNLVHPTDTDIIEFNIDKFILNTDKKLLHIGSFLRNIDYFYFIELNKVINKYIEYPLKKVILTGKSKKCKDVCPGHGRCHKHNEIEKIDFIDNESYDKLLSENIVFVNLIDASAVNLVLECIVRNTPILINRLPALEEILGFNYPFFYDNIEDIPESLNINDIKNVSDFLKKIKNDKFKLQVFVETLFEIIQL